MRFWSTLFSRVSIPECLRIYSMSWVLAFPFHQSPAEPFSLLFSDAGSGPWVTLDWEPSTLHLLGLCACSLLLTYDPHGRGITACGCGRGDELGKQIRHLPLFVTSWSFPISLLITFRDHLSRWIIWPLSPLDSLDKNSPFYKLSKIFPIPESSWWHSLWLAPALLRSFYSTPESQLDLLFITLQSQSSLPIMIFACKWWTKTIFHFPHRHIQK